MLIFENSIADVTNGSKVVDVLFNIQKYGST